MSKPQRKDAPVVIYSSSGLTRLAGEIALQDAQSRNVLHVTSTIRDANYAIKVDGTKAEIVVSYVVGKINYSTSRPL